ncbi:MAG: alpha-hydroxy-acid oxidizing protein [Blastocatellia bacterium]|nr:alpha-hydroxy-acid oxidizing protein [Blastocatellia bacterium]
MPYHSLSEFEEQARHRLDEEVYDLFAGGAADEITLRANESAFQRLRLVPRILRGAAVREIDVSLLGSRASLPVLIAPTAFHRLAHAEGECATARAAASAETIMIVSMAATVAIEEIAAASRAVAGEDASLWFQLYLQPDLGFTESIIRRAEEAGCRALIVTVDSPVLGQREGNLRNSLTDLPAGMFCENMRECAPAKGQGFMPVRKFEFSPEFSWDHIDWLRKTTSLPIALKGILHPDDAVLAVEHGASAVIVSNHGGRQLDTAPATIEALPAIAEALTGVVPLLLDGGIRRGTDILKALALGAGAVMIGRPVLWGLAVAGEDGVRKVLEILRAEFVNALALCGCSTLKEVNRGLVRGSGFESLKREYGTNENNGTNGRI